MIGEDPEESAYEGGGPLQLGYATAFHPYGSQGRPRKRNRPVGFRMPEPPKQKTRAKKKR